MAEVKTVVMDKEEQDLVLRLLKEHEDVVMGLLLFEDEEVARAKELSLIKTVFDKVS